MNKTWEEQLLPNFGYIIWRFDSLNSVVACALGEQHIKVMDCALRG